MIFIPGLAIMAMTFHDEFPASAAAPDTAIAWQTSYLGQTRTLAGNKEWEYYSDATVGVNPFRQDGKLRIQARPAAPGANPLNLPYSSGVITTFNSFCQLYGYFEVRAKLPKGKGLWPAFWLLPASGAYTAELDVFEVLGDRPGVLYATTHGLTGGQWSSNLQQLNVPDTSTAFHTYGVDWEADKVTFYMDRQPIAVAPTPASMNSPMYVLLNLAVGGPGSWPGVPDASTVFPAEMAIDYLRVYSTPGTKFVGARPVP